jgi:bifunctional DNA-binding transcriptional regulator/antitoxin component of YhaV-PrlF toxin-antitoxin module
MPALTGIRVRSSVYGLAAVDDRGRVMAHVVVGALGWEPGTRLAIREHCGLVIATEDSSGSAAVTGHGHLRLPAPVRRYCGLDAGCRVLLVADPSKGRVVMHPAAMVDAMITREYAAIFGGEAP